MGWRYNIYLYKRNRLDILAIVMDLFDLKIIGWSYGRNMTSEIVIEAFNKSKQKKSDNKRTDISFRFRKSIYIKRIWKEITVKNLRHSYSKKGYPYDNASMESFNAILKKEEVNVNMYETLKKAKLAIFEFIESWYNNEYTWL